MNPIKLAQLLDEHGEYGLADRIAGVLDGVPPHWRKQLETMRDSGRYDRRLIRYLGRQLKNAPERGSVDEYLDGNSGEAPQGLDPYAFMAPSETLNDWASRRWSQGGFDLTKQPLNDTLQESRRWVGESGEIKESLGDGWIIIRTPKGKKLRNWGTELQNCVEKNVHVDMVEEGIEEIWVVLRPDGTAAAMFNAKVEPDGSRPIEYIMGDANMNPDDETKQKIAGWLQKHPNYTWHGYTPIEEDDTYQFFAKQRVDFEKRVKEDIPNVGRYMYNWLFSRRFVATIADDIARQRNLIPQQVLEQLAREYPEVREALG